MSKNNSMSKNIHIVTNDDFFYLLFKTFVNQIDKDCVLEKIEMVHEVYVKKAVDETNLPLLILIDAKILRISPIDLVNILRSDLEYQMPIWFVTEIVSPMYINKILGVGANRIISKPFDPEKIAIEIAKEVNYLK